ncbi:MAG: flagellar hook-associated protein FlgL [Desulfobacterales bacterium]|jgi:flagellar hook-associated protein 3 FlgL|nr:flagellar hook-associated protein FlgL [Desulfobacterales bacterium]
MRITQNMMSNIFMGNLRRQTEAMLQRQEQIASQKRINRPSDDPGGMGRVLAGRSSLSTINQYANNIQQGKTRLEFSEETLSFVDELVQQARRIAEEKSGDSVTAAERSFGATQVKEIYDQVLQLANSKFGDRYMFSGDQTDTAAFTRDDDYNATYHGDDGSFKVPIADNVVVTIDADGRNYFQDGANGGVNIFDELRDLIHGLENADLAAGSTQIDATIHPLADAHVQIMDKRSEAGPKLYRLQATEEHWMNIQNSVQEAIGREEDVDAAQLIIELKNLETAYESTLAAASRIIQPSLVNFLK